MARKKQPPADEEKPSEVEVLSPDEYRLLYAGTMWGNQATEQDLTIEESMFVHSYVIDRNPVAALRRINHEGTNEQLKRRAAGYLTNPEVQAALDVLAKRVCENLAITADRVNERIAAVAFFDPREVIQADHNGMQMLHTRYWRRDQAYAISSIEMGQHGLKIKLHDGLRAAEMLGKQLGTIKDDAGEGAALAARAAAQVVVDKIMDYFDRTVPEDPVPDEQLVLAPPEGERLQ